MRDNVAAVHRVSENKKAINKGINMVRTSIDTFHHFRGTMNDTEVIRKQLLGPTTELVNNSNVNYN